VTHYVCRILAVVAIVACLLASAQCGAKNQTAPGRVRLIDPGAAPRKELRYRFKPGQRETMVDECTMSMGFEIGGRKTPSVEVRVPSMTTIIVVKDVSSDGTVVVEATTTELGNVTVLGTSPQDGEIARKLNDSFQKLIGSVYRYVISPEGLTVSAKTDLAQLNDEHLQGLVEAFNQAPTVPFPKEPVGVGARWEVTTSSSGSRIKVSDTATYTLLQMNGDTIKLNAVRRGDAPPQEISSATAGVVTKINSLDSSGSSVTEADLTKVVPTSRQIAHDILTDMSVTVTQRLKNKTGLKLETHRKDE
jgi:hypothetical protein